MNRRGPSGRRQDDARVHGLGKHLPCRTCHRPAFLRDAVGAPRHKVRAANELG